MKIYLLVFMLLLTTFQAVSAVEIIIKKIDGTHEIRNYDISTERLRFIVNNIRNRRIYIDEDSYYVLPEKYRQYLR